MRKLFGLLVVVAPLALLAADPTPKERFDKYVAEAKANLATPAGHTYDIAINKHFEEHFGPAMAGCFESTPNPDTSRFEMVFVLASDGKPSEILVWPQTNIAKCFSAKLAGVALPTPPRDKYLAYMEQKFEP